MVNSFLETLMQNDQIRHGNKYGEGHVFRLATPLHLQKSSRGLSATGEFLIR